MKDNFMTSLFPFLSQKDLLRWLQKYTETSSTIYDKAMDNSYNSSHVGGGDHRLFDGGHDFAGLSYLFDKRIFLFHCNDNQIYNSEKILMPLSLFLSKIE